MKNKIKVKIRFKADTPEQVINILKAITKEYEDEYHEYLLNEIHEKIMKGYA